MTDDAFHSLWWLNRATYNEGLRLARAVRDGDVTRAEVEAALEQYGDAEPAIALQCLDKWASDDRPV
jgi:hypothetical protein